MRNALALVFATGLVIGVAYGMHGPMLPVFAKNDVGASYSELGLVGLANFVPYMFIPLLVGGLLSRFNSAHLLAVGSATNAASIYLLSTAQSVPELMAYRAMAGVAHAFFWPPCESVISNASREGDRVRNISLFGMFFVMGFMAGPLAGNAVIDWAGAGYRILFQAAAAVAAATVVSALMASAGGAAVRGSGFGLGALRQFSRFPAIIAVLAYCAASFGVTLTIFPAFLNDRSMSDADVMLLYFVFGIARVATLAAGWRLARRAGTTLVCASLAVASGLLVAYWARSPAEFAVALSLMGFGLSVVFPLTLEIILSRTRRAASGVVIGAYETVFGIGCTVGPVAAGYLSHVHGSDAPYAVFFAVGIGIGILSIIRRRSLRPGRAGAGRLPG